MSFISAIRNQINNQDAPTTTTSDFSNLPQDSASETSILEVSEAESLIDQHIDQHTVFHEVSEEVLTYESAPVLDLNQTDPELEVVPSTLSDQDTQVQDTHEEREISSDYIQEDNSNTSNHSNNNLFTIAGDDSQSLDPSIEESSLPSFLENLKSRGFFVPDEEHLRTDKLENLKSELLSELKKLYIENKLVPSSLKDLLDSVEETYQHFKKNKHLDINNFYTQCLGILDKKGYTKDLSSNHVDF